jgi:Flp pilus assembly protein TadG
MVEFGLGFSLLMVLVVATAQFAILIHVGISLDAASREAAFQAALAGHGTQDGEQAAQDMWKRLEPDGGPLSVAVTQRGRLIVVDSTASAPALFPVPVPPFTHYQLRTRAVHTVEVFEPGSGG